MNHVIMGTMYFFFRQHLSLRITVFAIALAMLIAILPFSTQAKTEFIAEKCFVRTEKQQARKSYFSVWLKAPFCEITLKNHDGKRKDVTIDAHNVYGSRKS